MAAVRSEVDELRDKISKLEVNFLMIFLDVMNKVYVWIADQSWVFICLAFQDTVSFLSRENEYLRAHVSPEVLSNLPGPRGLPSGVCPETTQSANLGALQTQNNSGQSHS